MSISTNLSLGPIPNLHCHIKIYHSRKFGACNQKWTIRGKICTYPHHYKPWNNAGNRTFVGLKKSKFGFVRHTFDLPDILSDGRFLLPQKMSGDKTCMLGSDSYENNFSPPDKSVSLRWTSIYTSFEHQYTSSLITFLLLYSACHESLANQQLIRVMLKNMENRQRSKLEKK